MSREEIRHISIFIINRLLAALAAASLLSSILWAYPAPRQDAATLSQEVRKLGTVYNYDDQKTVADLEKVPRTSVQLLIEQLHPVREVRILASENRPGAEHVLWCIRALRYLTGGKDFCARTHYRFADSDIEQRRKYWLYFGHPSCVSFFAMWPSRGSEYIAPEDAQKEIIAEWKRWFAVDGASFDYKPLRHPKPEQWLW